MIFLIAGIFFGLLAILSVSHGGILIAVWWAVPSIVFIAAGIKKLSGTDSDAVLEAAQRMQKGVSGHPLSAEEIRRLQEQAQSRDADSTKARNTRQSKKE